MKPIRVTVGIPCYNAAGSIGRAVQSALTQDWPNIEVLVVDDCSTDESVSVVEVLARHDTRLRVIRQSRNAGAGCARATIVAEATGEFIAFFDDDDESDPARVRTQLRRIADYEIQAGTALVACYASGTRVYPNGYRFGLAAIGSQSEAPVGEEVADYLLFNDRKNGRFYGAGTPTCALMARKTVIVKAGGFDSNLRRVEDVDFAVRLALIGGHFVGCPESLFLQYATTGADKSASANYAAEQQLFEKHKTYLLRKQRYHYAQNWFRFRYYHFSRLPVRAFGALLLCLMWHPVLVGRHLFRSAPRRLFHEFRMTREQGNR